MNESNKYLIGTILLLVVGYGVFTYKPKTDTAKNVLSVQNSPAPTAYVIPDNASPTAYMIIDNTPTPGAPTPTTAPSKTDTQNGVQVLKATYSNALGFQPTSFTIKAGQPARLEVAAADDGQGCMGSIMLPQLLPRDIQFFRKGETNTFEFTAATPGTYQITCAMGVPHASITVE